LARLKYGSNPSRGDRMKSFQATPLPESLKPLIPQLAHDFRAAISYVSFYPVDSSFVAQSVQKLFEDFQKILQCGQPLIIRAENQKLYINDQFLSSFDDLMHLFQTQNILGVEIEKDISEGELTDWLQIIAFSLEEDIKNYEKNQTTHIRLIPKLNTETISKILKEPIAFALNAFESFDALTQRSHSNRIDGFHQNHQALLGFVEESWQFIQTQQKKMGRSTEITYWSETFDQFFKHLLDRMEKPSPDLKDLKVFLKNPSELFLNEIENLFGLEQ
jgi:hypothetical protein